MVLLRRLTPGARSDVHGTLWEGESQLSVRRSVPSAVFSEIVVGMGASLGREQAPQLLGAVSGSVLGRWARLPAGQRRLLVACGSGAGLAAVYNVPIGGALIIAELLFGEISLTVVLPALDVHHRDDGGLDLPAQPADVPAPGDVAAASAPAGRHVRPPAPVPGHGALR